MTLVSNKFYVDDPAFLAFKPFVDFSSEQCSSLMAQAITHWLSCESCSNVGAFMLPFRTLRKSLSRGGLSLEVNFPDLEKIKSAKAKSLLERYQTNSLEVSETFYLSRLLAYAGFLELAGEVLRKMDTQRDAEQELRRKYLIALVDRASFRQWSLEGLDSLFLSRDTYEQNSLAVNLRFDILLLLASYYLDIKKTPSKSCHFLHLASDIVASEALTLPSYLVSLLRARLARYQGVLYFLSKDEENFSLTFRTALSTLDDALLQIKANTPDYFLLLETKRRVADKYIFCLRAIGNLQAAAPLAYEITDYDPYCARAQMVCGEIYRELGKQEQAREYFLRATRLGLVERSYCLSKLAELYHFNHLKVTSFRQAICSDLFRERDLLERMTRFQSSLPAKDSILNDRKYLETISPT